MKRNLEYFKKKTSERQKKNKKSWIGVGNQPERSCDSKQAVGGRGNGMNSFFSAGETETDERQRAG